MGKFGPSSQPKRSVMGMDSARAELTRIWATNAARSLQEREVRSPDFFVFLRTLFATLMAAPARLGSLGGAASAPASQQDFRLGLNRSFFQMAPGSSRVGIPQFGPPSSSLGSKYSVHYADPGSVGVKKLSGVNQKYIQETTTEAVQGIRDEQSSSGRIRSGL